MTNQTLQTKYRPQTYNDVVGQEHITNILRGLRKNRGYTYSNSIIFYGGAGGGKTSNARIYAKSVNCLNPNDGEACNICENCVAFNKGAYPDFIEVDGASYGKVEDAKTLIQMFNQYTINKNGYRIILIDECHRLSKQAWDIFLKPLEEGNTKTIFLFATTEFDKIPPAIVSRSIVCQIRPASSAQIKAQLTKICKAEKLEYSDSALEKISYVFKGKMRDSIKTLDMYAKSMGHIKSVQLENIEERILEVIQLAVFNKINEAYDMLDETFIDSDFNRVLTSVLSTILLYPDVVVTHTSIPEDKLKAFSTIVNKDIVKKVCKDFAKYKPRNINDFKLFCSIISDYGVKNLSKELSTETKTKRTRTFVKDISQVNNVSSKKETISMDIPDGWSIQ